MDIWVENKSNQIKSNQISTCHLLRAKRALTGKHDFYIADNILGLLVGYVYRGVPVMLLLIQPGFPWNSFPLTHFPCLNSQVWEQALMDHGHFIAVGLHHADTVWDSHSWMCTRLWWSQQTFEEQKKQSSPGKLTDPIWGAWMNHLQYFSGGMGIETSDNMAFPPMML